MREAMLTVPKHCLRAYIVCPVTLHSYSPLKTTNRLKELIQDCFIRKKGQSRYKYIYLALLRDYSYFVNKSTLILPKSSQQTLHFG